MSSSERDRAELVARLERGMPSGASRHTTRASVRQLCDRLLAVLLPGYFTNAPVPDELRAFASELGSVLAGIAQSDGVGLESGRCGSLCDAALAALSGVRDLLDTDIDAAYASDPAAADRATVVLSYPCIEALAVQRFAHQLYRLHVPLLPRMLTEIAHSRTGIDIHPGARIGPHFFIDHGTGVVIGETSRIGAHCVLYQGVGLVAWNPLARDATGTLRRGESNKRHPDLEDHVTIYAGATVLGGDTVIGHHSVIGGNVWLTTSVAPWSVVALKDPETSLSIRQRTARPAMGESELSRPL